jgi:hypothetical protein
MCITASSFKDIFELSRATEGSGSYAWWNKDRGQERWDDSIVMLRGGSHDVGGNSAQSAD